MTAYRQTDRQTHNFLIARPRLHSMQRGKNVKNLFIGLSVVTLAPCPHAGVGFIKSHMLCYPRGATQSLNSSIVPRPQRVRVFVTDSHVRGNKCLKVGEKPGENSFLPSLLSLLATKRLSLYIPQSGVPLKWRGLWRYKPPFSAVGVGVATRHQTILTDSANF